MGIAGIYRTGRVREYVLAGLGLGVAIATKYTAGIVVVTLVAAALVSPVAHARLRNLVVSIALIFAGFFAANPYALLDYQAFREGLEKQTQTAGEEGGKLGLANTSGWRYYLGTFTWGLGWLPSLFAVGGGVAMAIWQRRLALLLAPAPILLFLYLGQQSRFFARWMLPVYPILCLLAAWAVVELASRVRFVRPAIAVGVLSALVLAQGLVFSVHNDRVLAQADTRWLARGVDEREHPGRVEHRRRADRARSVGDRSRQAAVLGHGLGQSLEQVAHVAVVFLQRHDGRGAAVPGGQARGLRAHRPGRISSAPTSAPASAGS